MTSRYAHLKVVVFGDHMIDRYMYCNAARISQEAPVMIVKKNNVVYRLGGASNVASNLRSLGAKVYVVGVAGRDNYTPILNSIFKEQGITDELIYKFSRSNTVKTRVVAQNQQLVRIDEEEETSISLEDEGKIGYLVKTINPDIIVVADYDKGNVTKSVISKLCSLKKPVFVNGKPENIKSYPGITALVCNDYEFKESLNGIRTNLIPIPGKEELLRFLDCKHIVRTQGDRGLILYSPNKEQFFKACKVIEVDSSGASDTVVATLALEYLKSDIVKASTVANKAASIVVTRFGTSPITYEDIKELI